MVEQETRTEAQTEPAEPLKDEVVESSHEAMIAGGRLAYTVHTGTLVLRNNEDNSDRANIFFVAYIKDVEDEAERVARPLVIAFNGGPGSSSVWLHLGVLGPRRVFSGDVDQMAGPPYELVDNDHSLLNEADLLFIDPVSTGYSRAAPGVDASQFHGVKGDAESVGDFIHLFVSRFRRWGSPKYLIGESYGSTRAAALSGYLQDRHGMYLNGIMLVSSILNFQTTSFTIGNDLAYILYLPSYAATAWYHRALDDELQAGSLESLLAEAEAFALGDYASALLKGARLEEAVAARVASQMARLTGLSTQYIRRNDLRITLFRFVKELLRDQERTVGRLDSRFQGIDRDSAGESFEYDPSYSAILGPYTATLNDYLGRELDYQRDLTYEILTSLHQTWNYSEYQNQFVDVAETLRASMTRNPKLRLLVASAYFDLATPYFATEYTLNHLRLDESLHANIQKYYYHAGHMMYVHEPSLAHLAEALRRFVAAPS
ncbi:MAG: peptidase S10 [Ardenticatenales bacterium]|nr:peptidase S10 [Ardenticatenales bacterium]